MPCLQSLNGSILFCEAKWQAVSKRTPRLSCSQPFSDTTRSPGRGACVVRGPGMSELVGGGVIVLDCPAYTRALGAEDGDVCNADVKAVTAVSIILLTFCTTEKEQFSNHPDVKRCLLL